MEILMKNCLVTDYSQESLQDILIKDGKIEKVGKILREDCQILDLRGKRVLPSFIDMHTHLRDPGFFQKETIETGLRAASKGGYTYVCAMGNTNPVADNIEVLQYVLKKAEELDICDVRQASTITLGLKGKEAVDFSSQRKYTDIFTDDGRNVDDDEIYIDALKNSIEHEFMIMDHCEDEVDMTKKHIDLIEKTGGRVHFCHTSTKKAMKSIIEAKQKGLNVTVEVTPHHLFSHDNDYRVNPKIATEEDRKYLIEAIKSGYIDAIATDHAPHTIEDKKNGAPGISLIEVAFSMVWKIFKEENIDIKMLSKLMSFNPAKLLKLNQGSIEEGKDASLVVIDEDKLGRIDVNEFISKGKNNPFQGEEVLGAVIMTMKKGRIIYDNR